LAIYTRFGGGVEIRYRCDDYEESGGVHIAFLDRPNGDLRSTFTYELRADGGIAEIEDTAKAAHIAHCTGKHDTPQGTRTIDHA